MTIEKLTHIYNEYFKPMINQGGSIPVSHEKMSLMFATEILKHHYLPTMERVKKGEAIVLKYYRPRKVVRNDKCDFCGRPHILESMQCLGCGAWKKEYR